MKLFKRVGAKFQEVARQRFSDEHFESHLEDLIEANPHLLGDLMIVGRQVRTIRNERIDLIALDRQGDVIIIELKRGPAHREIVAQINSYLTTIRKWRYDDLERLIGGSKSLEKALAKRFQEHFKTASIPEFNRNQRGIIVAEEIDEATLEDLANLRSPIIAIEFAHFPGTGGDEYLSMRVKSEAAVDASVEGTEPARAPRTRKEKFREYDEFLASVGAKVRQMLPPGMSSVKSTFGHWEKDQNRRFHWGDTDTHVGIYVGRTAEGDELSVYFYNRTRDPEIKSILSKNKSQIDSALNLTDGGVNFKDAQCPIDQALGNIDRNRLEQMIGPAAERTAAFLKVLKPLLKEKL